MLRRRIDRHRSDHVPFRRVTHRSREAHRQPRDPFRQRPRPHADEAELIRSRLETGQRPPLASALAAEVGVFVSGHTHAPSLTHFRGPTGRQGAIVNSGCWLRQLQPVPARLGVPPVFVSRFVQTHVRVYRDNQTTQVELWERERPVTQRLRAAERLAVAGRLAPEPDAGASPRVRARTTVENK